MLEPESKVERPKDPKRENEEGKGGPDLLGLGRISSISEKRRASVGTSVLACACSVRSSSFTFREPWGPPGGWEGRGDSRASGCGLNLLLCHSPQVSSHIQVLARRKSREIQSKLKVGTEADTQREGAETLRVGDRRSESGTQRPRERETETQRRGQ